MPNNAILLSDLIQRGMTTSGPRGGGVQSVQTYVGQSSQRAVQTDYGMSPLAYSSLLLSQRLAELADQPERNRTEILRAVEAFVSDLERLR